MSCAVCDDCPFTSNDGTIPYEIHITVEATSDLEAFKAACARLKVKPILLDLQVAHQSIPHLITSSRFTGGDLDAYIESQRIHLGLAEAGFSVIRRKIEAAPWHPMAPTRANGLVLKPGQYFECHIPVDMSPPYRRDVLQKLGSLLGLHVSRNAFKVYDKRTTYMCTLRQATVLEDFTDKVEHALKHITLCGFDIGKVITEFAIYDSNVDHDAQWLRAT